MNDLPEKFIENMKKQLPEDEWEAFFCRLCPSAVQGTARERLKDFRGGV